MARPRLPIGTYGKIRVVAHNGRQRAIAKFRDNDGKVRSVMAVGGTKAEATRRLKAKLAERAGNPAGSEGIGPATLFGDLAEVWVAQMKASRDLEDSTKDAYEWNLRAYVLPRFRNFTLREMSVQRCDEFLLGLNAESYSKAKKSKSVLSLVMGLALRYEAIIRNPVASCSRLKPPQKTPDAFSDAEIAEIRKEVRQYRTGDHVPGPKPDPRLPVIIDTMLGTSGRIGETLALRRKDIDMESSPARVHFAGTIACVTGQPIHRKPRPKTEKSNRWVAIPRFTEEALAEQLTRIGDDPEGLVFPTRNGTPMHPHNTRRLLRTIMKHAGIEGVHPHKFRRTVGTAVGRAAGVELASELLGHTTAEMTKKHYIEPATTVDARTADILERFGGDPEVA